MLKTNRNSAVLNRTTINIWDSFCRPAPSRNGRSTPARCLDRRDVDLLHRHHRLERAFRLSATGRKRIAQHPRGDLPREAPAVLAPAALTFLAAVADDRIP